MNRWNWLEFGLIGGAAVAIAIAAVNQPPPSALAQRVAEQRIATQPDTLSLDREQSELPKRHKITVTLTSPDDLKVKSGDRIKVGDAISDRTSAREQLEAKKRQLEVAIAQMSLPLNQIASLPPPNLEAERVALKKAQFELDRATEALSHAGLRFKDPSISEVMEPEKVKELSRLKQRQLEAGINVEAALARLSEAKTRYQQQQYQHSIQMAARQTDLQKQQYDLASLTSQLQEVEGKLGELIAVRSPYGGRVRRVKILGQNDRNITAEITLDIRQSDR